ncbi:MAG: disulfide bond formation protein DsbB [Colwellia sp.]
MKFLSDFTTNSTAWLLLALSALGLELSALYFQYVMDLAPCIMCVYQRTVILALLAAGVIGFIGCKLLIARVVAYALWVVGSIWGLLISIEHVELQANSGSIFFTCEIIPNFPNWAPLHQWFPAFFEATGSCGDINWRFLDFSMPQWMIVVFTLYTITFAIVLINRLVCAKKC